MIRMVTAYTLMMAGFLSVQQRLLILVSSICILVGIIRGILLQMFEDPDRFAPPSIVSPGFTHSAFQPA